MSVDGIIIVTYIRYVLDRQMERRLEGRTIQYDNEES